MRVSKWGNSLAVRLPSAVVDALGLKEGDQIEIRIVDKRVFEVGRDESRQRALARLRKLLNCNVLCPPDLSSTDRKPMPGRAFLDTNILIYALARGDPRSKRAEELLAVGGVLSVQILNEFVSVARRNILMSWGEVTEALDVIRALCSSPLPLTVDTHEAAVKIAEKHGYGIYDAMVVATALEAGCDTLYSVDLQDAQTINGQVTIRNPFAP